MLGADIQDKKDEKELICMQNTGYNRGDGKKIGDR